MSVIIQGDQVRAISLGEGPVSKASGALVASSNVTCFTVTGGEVLITGLWLKVTTSMTVANTLSVTNVPTAGNTATIVTATDLGTTDSVAGTVVGLGVGTTGSSPAAPKFLIGGRVDVDAVVTTGSVLLNPTGTSIDGAVTVYVTWVPLTSGAVLAAA